MTVNVESARLTARKLLRDARDVNEWRKIAKFRLWMPVVLQLVLIGVVAAWTEWVFDGQFLSADNITRILILALPLIIGIGIDDGVHLIHRYHYEGKDAIFTVFSSTGKAIIITSLTTMLAFGSLIFAIYRGFGSLGSALFLGVGTCLLASLFILPALLAMTEKNK